MRGHRTIAGLLLAASMLFSACGSSPPVRYYSLEPMPVEYVKDGDDALVLGLGPLRLADYLKRSQMVSRGTDAEIVVDQQTRWAEPLGAAIQRILATNVDGLLDTVAVVGFPDTDTAEIDYRVVGRVHRFDIDRTGLAVLEVQWQIEDTDGAGMMPPRRDRFESPAARRDDPGSEAAALSDTLAQFSRRIADGVRDLAAPG